MLVKLRKSDDLWLVLTNTCYDDYCGNCFVNLNKDYTWMPLEPYSEDLLYYRDSGKRNKAYDIMEVYSVEHVNYSIACNTINKQDNNDLERNLVYSRAMENLEIKNRIKNLENEILTLKGQLVLEED